MMEWAGLITLLAPVIIKLVEWLLDKSKLNKEQAKAILELIKESQSQPVSSQRIREILSSADDDIKKQEEALKNDQ